MCGIAGFTGPPDSAALRRMARSIAHRGPDADGYLEDAGVSLASRRLGIIDLAGGDQPVFNEDRTVAVVYNGEIYNAPELRAELEGEGHRFATRTDTEVLVHLYERDGLELPKRLRGMFAFALWDRRMRRLVLARDQLGIKPLFYGERSGRLLFGSEAKAILAHGTWPRRPCRQAVHDLLNLRYVPGPLTLFEGILKLPPGWLLEWRDGSARLQEYYRLPDAVDRKASLPEAADRVRELLERSIEDHLLSDVEVGLYLSGGLDSGGLLALLHRLGKADRPAFTLGFRHPSDENGQAAELAARFGARHRQAYVDPRPLELLDEATWHVEEPRVNSLQGYCLAALASSEVKAVLGGLGGDELFAGYELVDWVLRLGAARGPRRLAGLPAALNAGLLSIEKLVPRLDWQKTRRGVQLLLARRDWTRFYLILRNAWDLDRAMFDRVYTPAFRRDGVRTTEELFASHFAGGEGTFLESVLRAEMRTKLVDEYLATEDRVSMAHSLEVRVPFLDLPLVEYALSLPGELKADRPGRKKLVYRRALQGLLPSEVLQRPKAGFSFDPVAQFERDLRDRARAELTVKRLEELEYFEPRFLHSILEARPRASLRWHYFFLWTVLAYSSWHRVFIEGGVFIEGRPDARPERQAGVPPERRSDRPVLAAPIA